MTDERNVSAQGCLGRSLITLGLAWLGLIFLGGVGLIQSGGRVGEFLAAFAAGGFIPAFALLAGGRALTRRAKRTDDVESLPQRPVRRQPAPPSRPTTTVAPPRQPAPRPRTPATPVPPPRSLEEVLGLEESESDVKAPGELEIPPLIARPKSSQEMIEEARRKFGTGGRHP